MTVAACRSHMQLFMLLVRDESGGRVPRTVAECRGLSRSVVLQTQATFLLFVRDEAKGVRLDARALQERHTGSPARVMWTIVDPCPGLHDVNQVVQHTRHAI